MTIPDVEPRSPYRFMSIIQVLSKAFEIYTGNFGRYLRIILFFMIPISVLQIYLGDSWQELVGLAVLSALPLTGIIALTHHLFTENQQPSFIDDISISELGKTAVRIVAAGMFTGALALLIAWVPVTAMVLPLSLLTDVYFGICAAILIVPSLIVVASYQFVAHAIVLRGQSINDSLKYSSRLALEHLAHAMSLMVLLTLFILLPPFILGRFISPYEALISPFFTAFAGVLSTVAFLNLEQTGFISDSSRNSAKVERLVEQLDEDGFEWQAVESPDEVAELKRDGPN